MTEYVEAIRERYRKASRPGKRLLLDEFVQVTGYHRKTGIRLLREGKKEPGRRRGRPRRYGAEAAGALKEIWEVAGCICSRRLQPFLPEMVEVLARKGRMALSTEVTEQLLAMSPSTVDRLLRPYRRQVRRRGMSTTKPGSMLKRSIPIRTFSDWEEGRPGFLEVDLVVHCGESAEGFYLSTLNTVDVHTGWVECHGVWGKGQEKVRGAIHQVRKSLPFALLGLDSDNGSEFINHELHGYCEREGIIFTRSRPYKKNDSAHVEQKNWTVVRQQVGYDRYSSREALGQLNHVYSLLRLYVNFFQPVMKLMEKTRTGARVRKVYDTARTPYRRLLESAELSPETRQELADMYLSLDPTLLGTQLDRALDQLWTMADRPRAKEASVTAFMRQASVVG